MLTHRLKHGVLILDWLPKRIHRPLTILTSNVKKNTPNFILIHKKEIIEHDIIFLLQEKDT